MDDALRERVDALERAVTDGDCDLTGLTEEAEALQRLETVEAQLDELDDRVAELEAATQALRGYVGNIRSVNRDVEQRADAALAKASELERALDDEGAQSPRETESTDTADTRGSTATTAAAESPSSQQTDDRRRCQACGRPHDEREGFGAEEPETRAGDRQANEQSFAPSVDRADSGTETAAPVTDPAENGLPETTEETGTLQRVRELL